MKAIKKILTTCIIGALSFTASAQGQFKNHGPQVFAAAIQGSHFIKGKDGKEYIFTVVRGVPARLVGYDLATGSRVIDSELNGTDGSWDMELSSDNILYMTGNGKMYSYTLGQSAAKDLGLTLPNQKVVWDLVAGDNGVIYGGTYPDCQVYEYHPKTGFKDIGEGSMKKGENYVRSLAYDSKRNTIYAGLGSHAAFIEYDLKSKIKKDILQDQDKDHEFVYDMELISDCKVVIV